MTAKASVDARPTNTRANSRTPAKERAVARSLRRTFRTGKRNKKKLANILFPKQPGVRLKNLNLIISWKKLDLSESAEWAQTWRGVCAIKASPLQRFMTSI